MSNCSICLDTTKDPFQSKCYHTFCNKCIMEWVAQHDDCPLCRNPISDTPTITNYEDEDDDLDNQEPIYIIDINETIVSIEELDEVDNRVNDFIDTLDKPLSIYRWKESVEGSWYTTIRKNNYYIDMKIDIVYFENWDFIKVCVELHKRAFVKPKDYKYRKKQIKLNKFRNTAYLYK